MDLPLWNFIISISFYRYFVRFYVSELDINSIYFNGSFGNGNRTFCIVGKEKNKNRIFSNIWTFNNRNNNRFDSNRIEKRATTMVIVAQHSKKHFNIEINCEHKKTLYTYSTDC